MDEETRQSGHGRLKLDVPVQLSHNNSMMNEEKVTFVPPLRQGENGWLNIDGKTFRIVNIHTFDDFGVEHETLTLEDGSEYFTQDGGETIREVQDY